MKRILMTQHFASAKGTRGRGGLACLLVLGVFVLVFAMKFSLNSSASSATIVSPSLSAVASGLKQRLVALSPVEKISPKILQIRFVNLQHVSEEELHQALGFRLGDAIWSANLNTARESLTQLAWVRDVELHRSLDGTVVVTLLERTPCARHQSGGAIEIIDSQGVSLPQGKNELQSFAHLPALVGQGAETGWAFWQEWSGEIDGLNTELLAATRVRDRRWDLLLRDGVVIALPEENWRQALSLLGDLERETGLVSFVRHNRHPEQTPTIDLRVRGRVRLKGLSPLQEEGA